MACSCGIDRGHRRETWTIGKEPTAWRAQGHRRAALPWAQTSGAGQRALHGPWYRIRDTGGNIPCIVSPSLDSTRLRKLFLGRVGAFLGSVYPQTALAAHFCLYYALPPGRLIDPKRDMTTIRVKMGHVPSLAHHNAKCL